MVNGDVLDEINEQFVVNLSNPSNATFSDSFGVATITDDDPLPALSIGDATVTEGDSGTVDATFTVTLAPVSGRTVSVQYATADGSATAGADYTAIAATTLTFLAGETSKTITVPVNGDLLDEPDENFTVNLSGAVFATITDSVGAGTITDDDALPQLSVDDVTITEGDSGQPRRGLHGQPEPGQRSPGDRAVRNCQRLGDGACRLHRCERVADLHARPARRRPCRSPSTATCSTRTTRPTRSISRTSATRRFSTEPASARSRTTIRCRRWS